MLRRRSGFFCSSFQACFAQKLEQRRRLAPFKRFSRVITRWGVGFVVDLSLRIQVEVRNGVREWVEPDDVVLVDLLLELVLGEPVVDYHSRHNNRPVKVDDYVQMPFLDPETRQVFLKFGTVSMIEGSRCRVAWINDGTNPSIPHIWSFWITLLSAAS